MKTIYGLCLILLATGSLLAQSEEDQVREVLNEYLQGTSYTYPDRLKEIFATEANLYVPDGEDGLRTIPIPEYIDFFKKENEGEFTGREGKIAAISIHGSMAYGKVVIEVPAGGFRFIDLFLLLKLGPDWTIISKAATREPYTPSEIPAEVQNQIDELLVDFSGPDHPGASIAVLRQGETIFERSYGMANLEYDQPMNEQTLVALGSVSKHFTTFALLLLEQRGLLSLEDDIHEYLPELPDYGYPISLREIAWHLSGIRSNLELLGMQGYGPSDALSEDFVRNIIYDQAGLNFPPGSDFSYSNSGYFLLADVISTVSGQDFASFLQAEIFAPLGMEQTFVMNDYAQVLDQRSYSYYQEGDQFVNAIMNRASIGSTGIWTTLADFKKWGQNFSTKSLGNEALFNALCQEGVLNNGRGIQYGLGMAIGTHLGSPLFHHGGGTSGYRTYLAHLPDQDLTILLLSNHGSFNGEAIARSVADLLHPELADSPIATAMPPLDRADLSAEELTIYTGDYLDTNHHFSREIILRDDSLFIQYPWGESWMMPLVNGNFWVAEDRYQIQFPDLATASSYVVYQEGSLEASATYERYDLQSLSAAELAAFTGTFYSEALNVVYRIELNEEQLAIHHSRMGELPLQAYKADHFLVNSWRMNGLQFERDENQKITGFKLSSNRNRGLHFRKI